MPTTLNFRKLFGKTPFKPMRKHMDLAVECASQIPEALDAFLKGDKDRLKDLRNSIFELEENADALLEELQSRLPKSVFMPVDRGDLLDVLDMQEAIADRAQDIVGLLIELPPSVPEGMKKPMMRLTKRVVDAVQQAGKLVDALDELVQVGFKSPDVAKLYKLISDVVKVETDADNIGIELTHALFSHRSELDAVQVVFLYQLVNWIDDLADFAEKLAIRTRLLIAR